MKDVLVDSYLCTHISRLLNFNTDDMASFDINEILTSCNKENLKCQLMVGIIMDQDITNKSIDKTNGNVK